MKTRHGRAHVRAEGGASGEGRAQSSRCTYVAVRNIQVGGEMAEREPLMAFWNIGRRSRGWTRGNKPLFASGAELRRSQKNGAT